MTHSNCIQFYETPVFTKQASGGLFEDTDLLRLQLKLLDNPQCGDLIVGSGGLRKIRLRGKGKGSSGGFRVIYYAMSKNKIYLLLAYPKSELDNLTKEQLAILRRLIESEPASGG